MPEQEPPKPPASVPGGDPVKKFNPEDPYGVKAVLEEKERKYKEAASKPKPASPLKWLMIFGPMYLLVAMPFAIWLKNTYESPDAKLEVEQKNAFVADDSIDYLKDDSTATVSVSTPTALPETDPLEELFGGDRLTTLSSLFASRTPQQVQSFFDSETVISQLVSDLKVGNAWNSADGMLQYLSSDRSGKALLGMFLAQSEKPEILRALLASKTFLQIAASPAVEQLNASYSKYASLAVDNQDLARALALPAVNEVLSNTPATALFIKAVSAVRESRSMAASSAPKQPRRKSRRR